MTQWRAAIGIPELKPQLLEFVASPARSSAARDILTTVQQALDTPDPLASLNIARALAQRYPAVEGVVLWTASVEVRCGRASDAAALLGRAMDSQQKSTEIPAMAARLSLARRQWNEALSLATEWRRRSADPVPADIARAKALVGLGRPEEAIVVLQPYVGVVSSGSGRWAELILTDAAALQAVGKSDKVIALLLDHAADGADWRALSLSFATEYLNIDEARTWITRVAGSSDGSSRAEADTFARAWAALAGREAANPSDRDEAKRRFDAIASRPDASATELEQAGMFAEQTGDLPKAMILYAAVLRQDANRPIAQNNLAMLLAATGGNLHEASAHAVIAVGLDRTEPAFLDTLATVQQKAGDGKAAIDAWRKAVELDPENPKWRVTLAEAYLDGRRLAECSQMLASIDSTPAAATSMTPTLRKKVDDIRQKLARLQSANAGPANPLTVAR